MIDTSSIRNELRLTTARLIADIRSADRSLHAASAACDVIMDAQGISGDTVERLAGRAYADGVAIASNVSALAKVLDLLCLPDAELKSRYATPQVG